ncbi:MAG: FHA domain-containing protein [Chloroflexi bacterium]|nr:FHA domain-containing protein [Chloroflexota bacterium]
MKERPNASLQIERGLDGISNISLDTPNVVFGSSSSSNAVLPNSFVSRRHFQVRSQDGVHYISDLDSTNGTYLNGERLVPNIERRVKDGDLIALATDQVVFRFIDPVGTERIDPSSFTGNARPSQGDLVVDQASREVWVRGQRQAPPLSRKEFDILEIIHRNKGDAVSREDIGAAGWPERGDAGVSNEEIDQYILRLRRVIEVDPSHPKLILTLRGFGFRMP